jgi:hypothetical protein
MYWYKTVNFAGDFTEIKESETMPEVRDWIGPFKTFAEAKKEVLLEIKSHISEYKLIMNHAKTLTLKQAKFKKN